jgi:uncharacterized membrane protein YccC
MVALYLAFLFDFEEPKWAGMTVWIVAQGSRGMSLSKSQYRLAGTIVGAVVGVALIGAFAQTPELFFLALALWVGFCTAVSTALRNFRSYGAVLAGYTAAIISIAAASRPSAAFDVAIARLSCIALGVVTEAVFNGVFAPEDPLGAVKKRLAAYLKLGAEMSARALRGEDNRAEFPRLFSAAVEMDSAGKYAAAASPSARRKFGHLRGASTAAMAALAAAQAFREHVARHGRGDEPLIARVAELIDETAKAPAGKRPEIAALRADVRAAIREDVAAARPLSRLFTLERLEGLIGRVEEALTRGALFLDPRAPDSRLPFHVHIDWIAAIRNGVRAFIAVLAAAAAWVYLAWPSGGTFVVIVAVVCALFATRPNSVASGVGFLEGAAAASVVALFCNFAILPAMSGFAMLALAVAPFLILGGLAMRIPKLAGAATGFTMFFFSLVGPDNATRAAFADYLNDVAGLLVGIGFGTLIFALVLPRDPRRDRRRLHEAVRRDLEAIGQNPARWTQQGWLTRTADRVVLQAGTRAAVTAQEAESEMRGMLAALTIGYAAIALSRLPRFSDDRLARAAMRRLGDGDPRRLARTCRLAARRFTRLATGAAPPDRDALRAALMMEDIAEAAESHMDFLEAST